MVKSLDKQKKVSRRSQKNNNSGIIELNNYRNKKDQSSQKSPRRNRNQSPKSTAKKSEKKPSNLKIFSLYLFRLIIAGIGLATIGGTALHYISQKQVLLNPQLVAQTEEKTQENPLENGLTNPLTLTQEMTTVKTQIEALIAKNPKLQPELFFVDLDNGNYLDINGSLPIPAASTIKIPLLIAFFQDVDAGKIKLDEKLTMTEKVKVGEAGTMQFSPIGSQFSALETVTKMIVISDNTATNMILERLGGQEIVNQRFREWGLENTVINNILPDIEGKNLTTPKDLAYLLALVNNGEILSLKSRDWVLEIMQKTETRTLLPQGIENNAMIAHKTGTLNGILADAGIIDTTNGKRYIGVVIVKRPPNDNNARTLIQEISRTVYTHIKNTVQTNSNPSNVDNSNFISTPSSKNVIDG